MGGRGGIVGLFLEGIGKDDWEDTLDVCTREMGKLRMRWFPTFCEHGHFGCLVVFEAICIYLSLASSHVQ